MSHYIRFALEPHCTDVLRIRKSLQDALTDAFGVTAAGAFVDVLAVDEDGAHAVVRVHLQDAQRVLAAVVGASSSLRCRAVKDTSFLPSLASGFMH